MVHIAQFQVLNPHQTGNDSQINILQFQNFTQGKSEAKTHAKTGSNN